MWIVWILLYLKFPANDHRKLLPLRQFDFHIGPLGYEQFHAFWIRFFSAFHFDLSNLRSLTRLNIFVSCQSFLYSSMFIEMEIMCTLNFSRQLKKIIVRFNFSYTWIFLFLSFIVRKLRIHSISAHFFLSNCDLFCLKAMMYHFHSEFCGGFLIR